MVLGMCGWRHSDLGAARRVLQGGAAALKLKRRQPGKKASAGDIFVRVGGGGGGGQENIDFKTRPMGKSGHFN